MERSAMCVNESTEYGKVLAVWMNTVTGTAFSEILQNLCLKGASEIANVDFSHFLTRCLMHESHFIFVMFKRLHLVCISPNFKHYNFFFSFFPYYFVIMHMHYHWIFWCALIWSKVTFSLPFQINSVLNFIHETILKNKMLKIQL